MTDAPERIWLNDAGDYKDALNGDLTWCDEPQDDKDTEYVRLDVFERSIADARDDAIEEAAELVSTLLWAYRQGAEVVAAIRALKSPDSAD